MNNCTEFLKRVQKIPCNDPKSFDLDRYIEKNDHGRRYATRFGNIVPGALMGTNVNYKGRDNA